ncbi:glycogen operon protein GlgX homolog [Sphaerisporangium melleum]|uniref:Glycogen operon protein GlgX homolog n=1 Tax=Sphaerisporangium melleum TaxID=321316 RepID=A0A917QQB0_9ACTN|nr:glycogen debranching protein GlgX [Sphaerisporangium melleum]GGK63334.1 glycogen operon protein GlgX homolog [Sphaerisporangium melleum]GII68070.1 glycogen operon protein GlgX homolog [Sphaerisporangium melleum]
MTATSLETMRRIDAYPTHQVGGYGVRAGRPYPYGAWVVPGGVNFAVFSDEATSMTLVLFERGAAEPMAELEFPAAFRTGCVFAMTVFGLDHENIEYGYRADGPFNPVSGHRFDPRQILSDPYARLISGRDVWGTEPNWDDPYPYRSRVCLEDFDWSGDAPPGIPAEDLVIYETHVRGFTRHPSSGVTAPGTFAGLREKIPYLRDLGVNCIELLPIFEFDETDNPRTDPATGRRLHDYWGYNTVSFFAPKAGYAATGRYGMQGDEFRTLVKDLHAAGIEVILDVVFNHTAEGNEQGPTISFKGLGNSTYYMLTPEGYYFNFSGTGNTVNCNHPVVRQYVLDCLRHWVADYHVDGFRFDLAAILGRDLDGTPLPNPPLLELLAHDPVLRHTKLIAEAWDAAGLYEVGSFPAYGRWAEWNGKYRDTVRRFLKGDSGVVGELATRVAGSPDLYAGRGTTASINFLTAHDGFTLADMVSYNDKHNEANGENNNDGANDNNSWNHGAEGPTDDPEINALRMRQMKNAMAILLTSQGVPMILAGDEVGRTQQGNNNTYCQDNELSWMDWESVRTNAELLRFTRAMIAFRHAHPELRTTQHPTGMQVPTTGLPDISWHGERAWDADWSDESRLLAVMRSGTGDEDVVYVAMNAHWDAHDLQLPGLPGGRTWHLFADTGAAAPYDLHQPGAETPLENPGSYLIGPRSVVVLVGRESAPHEQGT